MIEKAAEILTPMRIDAALGSRTDDQLLVAAARTRLIRDQAQTAELIIAANWADSHPVDEGWQTLRLAGHPVNAPSVPTTTSAAAAELGLAMRSSTIAAAHLIGDALELRHRLPRLWGLLMEDRLPAGRARAVAERTRLLADEAAAFVDRHTVAVAGIIGPDQLDRLVTEAIHRHDPDTAAELATRAADSRGVWLDERADLPGMSSLTATLDAGDAQAVDVRLDDDAHHLAELLPGLSHQARRATALGDLARRQPSLPTDAEVPFGSDANAGRALPTPRPPRPVTLYLHLSEHAVHPPHPTTHHDDECHDDECHGAGCDWGRVQHSGSIVPADLVREWLRDPTVRLTIKPVIDLNEPMGTAAYAVPERIAEFVRLRDATCVFPWCTTPSTEPGVDIDHIVPYAEGGPTHTDNLAPLCRRHHRLKTFDGWTYRRDPVTAGYHWRSPAGQVADRSRDGTTGGPVQQRPDGVPGASPPSASSALPPDDPLITAILCPRTEPRPRPPSRTVVRRHLRRVLSPEPDAAERPVEPTDPTF